ncbi:MAG: peroxiredoxin family protein [Gammaproteobacteria bacterium]|uniref:peroxiredoxin family protein n=1 Tax=Azohydromonas sp. TaxID=1872666 RepID=UPI002CD30611|nr:TlpA disulfide reductase family protein [Azohydromonas sp.]HMM86712.1 TlpA disulfide reductase family protein [Azohydromonas sp.]
MPTTTPRTPPLPEWDVATWLNCDAPVTLASLRGRVVLIHAFQMLCPGCVAYGLPQAERVRQGFAPHEVAVVALHTVFEHHAAMSVDALRAFVHEYRWSFPIGVDRPGADGGVPRTMRAYGLRGTPSHIVLDRNGIVHMHHFGRVDDLVLGATIGRLLAQDAATSNLPTDAVQAPGRCTPEGCAPDRVDDA